MSRHTEDWQSWVRLANTWAQQEADVLLDELGIPLHLPVMETICLTPATCDGKHLGLQVVAVLAGEYIEGVGWVEA